MSILFVIMGIGKKGEYNFKEAYRDEQRAVTGAKTATEEVKRQTRLAKEQRSFYDDELARLYYGYMESKDRNIRTEAANRASEEARVTTLAKYGDWINPPDINKFVVEEIQLKEAEV